jgi:MOSC domain-containing protein YiiM
VSRGALERIWIKRARRGPMDAVEWARAVAGRGLLGNADLGGYRQVTVVDADAWQRACAELGRDVDPAQRRANLLIRGIDLAHTRGRILRVGAVRMRVFDETRPCERMDRAASGLRAALRAEWRGGASVQVLDDGELAVGDPVELEPAETAAVVDTPAPEPRGPSRRRPPWA